MNVCKRVIYSGRVQGVGFRYTAQSVARGFAVTGFVRNLATGDVEVVAEGAAGDVEAFLAALSSRMAGNIEHQVVEDDTPTGLQAFIIRI
jgi:acylphosphatase